MFRKLAFAIVGALTIGAGVASAPAPAAAQFGFHFGGGHNWHHNHGPRFGFGFYPRHYGYPRYHYYDDDYYPRRHCKRVVVRKKIHGEWRKVVQRRCYRPHRYRY